MSTTNYIKCLGRRPSWPVNVSAFTDDDGARQFEEHWFFDDADEGSVWSALKAYQAFRLRQVPGARMAVSVYRPIALAPEIPPVGATEWKQGRRAA